MVNAGWLCCGEGLKRQDRIPFRSIRAQRSQRLFNNIKSSSRWSRWKTLIPWLWLVNSLLWRWVLRVWMELHSSFETAHARCFCGPVSFDVWCWDVTSRRKKLCGKFSMCWYVSRINGCFDIAGVETLILPSFMCHSLKWKKGWNYITLQCRKSIQDPQLFWLRPAFILHCVCWWNVRLYCLI